MSGTSDIAACAALVERGDPARFRTAMMAPMAAREALFVLYAFNVEVSRAPWVTQEAMIAEMRLQWWRDVLEEIAGGGPVRRHEVATPLAALLQPAQANRLDTLVAARRWDIYRDPFEDAQDLDRYLTQTAATLMEVAAELLGAPDSSAVAGAGYASGVAGFLRAVPELERQGRVPLVDGTRSGVAALARRGLDALASARRAGGIPRGAVPALWPATASEPALRAADRAPEHVAEGTLPEAGLGLTLRAALGRW
ncbi:squalene/phytoene synthase family protein [Sulfitobacter sp. HNIBRBA3233]|uniref:phytoene/squalene synthase family protein n=1 Tax=Sulfitobacter marinivivus TaxID=3158558 RepID=UPI0032DEE1BE